MEPDRKKRLFKEVREWTFSLVIALGVALLFQNYAYSQTKVEMNSMQNTLFEGQRLIEDKIQYRFSEPKRGDIIIINGPESDRRLVKRVIALPGETIDIRDGEVYIDGVKLKEPYAKGTTSANGLAMPYTVPEGKVFAMGDNREVSLDSRELGPIAFDSVEGKVIFRIWPLSDAGTID